MLARLPVAALMALLVAGPAAALCPFCSSQGQTLSGEVQQADLIVLGTLSNAKHDPADPTRGTTDLAIKSVIKPHPFLAGKTTVTLPKYLPDGAKASDTLFLVYGAVFTRPGEVAVAAVAGGGVLADPAATVFDPYRGVPVPPTSPLPQYLQGAIAVREKEAPARLRYFFDFLDSPDQEIAADAMMEFGNADYKDVRELAKTIPADKVLRWLRDPNTPPSRYGLFGLMIGHCGKREDAAAVRALLDDPVKSKSSGADGLLAAFILLDPQAGWDYLYKLLQDPSQEFSTHYAGLRTLRFFYEFRPDVLKPEQLLAGLKALVEHKELADLPIDDLRKWGRWDQTDYVLSFAGKESHNKVPIIKRAILKFALSAPKDNAAAKAYVEQVRKEDPERVKYVEQLLADEPPPAAKK